MEFVMRNKRRHYVYAGGKWAEVGRGFAKFEEKKMPEVVERQYFHEGGTRVRITGYSPEIEYELDTLTQGDASKLIRGITERELSGEAAEVRVLTVDMSASSSGGAYPAICRKYAVVADASGGEDVLVYKGKLVCASPSVSGVFVVQSGVFAREVD
jgi:hypothetical protein